MGNGIYEWAASSLRLGRFRLGGTYEVREVFFEVLAVKVAKVCCEFDGSVWWASERGKKYANKVLVTLFPSRFCDTLEEERNFVSDLLGMYFQWRLKD